MYVFNILNTRIKILLYWVGGGASCNFISIEKLILWVSFLLPVSTKFSNCVNIHIAHTHTFQLHEQILKLFCYIWPASQVMNLQFDQQFYPIRIRLIGSMVAAAILTYSWGGWHGWTDFSYVLLCDYICRQINYNSHLFHNILLLRRLW